MAFIYFDINIVKQNLKNSKHVIENPNPFLKKNKNKFTSTVWDSKKVIYKLSTEPNFI